MSEQVGVTAPPLPAVPAEAGRAAVWMIGAIAGFSSMAVAGRQLAGAFDTFEIMTYRSAIGLVLVLAGAALLGRMHEITARALGLHLARNIAHFAGQNLWLAALTMIPLAQLFAIEFSSPVLVALLAALVLGERLTRTRIASAALGFAGILLVARPFGAEAGFSLGQLAALGTALSFAVTAILTKTLTLRAGVPVTSILLWLSAMQLVMGLIMAGHDGAIAWPDATQALWLGVIGVAGLGAHLCLTTALSIAPASVVMPMDFLRLPLIALVGALVYAEPLDAMVLLGAAVIFGANYLNIWTESRRRRAGPRP